VKTAGMPMASVTVAAITPAVPRFAEAVSGMAEPFGRFSADGNNLERNWQVHGDEKSK
jgi:hypothetical protein